MKQITDILLALLLATAIGMIAAPDWTESFITDIYKAVRVTFMR